MTTGLVQRTRYETYLWLEASLYLSYPWKTEASPENTTNTFRFS